MTGFRFNPSARYRMPVLFGPTAGPRQGPSLERFDSATAPFTVTAARFRTDDAALKTLLPERFALDGDAILTVEHTVLHDLAWLAGRSYSMLGFKAPVVFDAQTGPVRGDLLMVLWENLCEPIVSGREELGYNKLYADLPAPQVMGDRRICRAAWDGHCFAELTVSNLVDAPQPAGARKDGVLHFAYRPPLRGETHDECVTVMLGPPPVTPPKVHENRRGDAMLTLNRASFEQMPTQFHIVNTLADLPQLEMLGGRVWRGTGKTDLREQHALD